MSFLPFSRPELVGEELTASKTVSESGWITPGPATAKREEAFCTSTANGHGVAAPSATTGIHTTLMILSLHAGYEVITPSMAWVATINMISLLRATRLMTDIGRDRLMITPEVIEGIIAPRTRAMIPVHYAGAPADIDAIRAPGERQGIANTEDAASAPGSHLVGVILNRHDSQHSAIMAGFSPAWGDLFIMLDAGLQNPPEEIPRLIAAAQNGYAVVSPVRQNRQDTRFRRKASRAINLRIQRATGKAMGVYACLLRAYRRHIVDAMLHGHERSTFIPILTNTFARRTPQLPVPHAERKLGNSNYSFMRLVNLTYDLLTLLTTLPLSVVASLIVLAGFTFSVVLMLLRLSPGAAWTGEGVVVLLAVLFMFVGAQFIAMGLPGEYIGRLFSEVRTHPRDFIQRINHSRKDASEKEIKK